MSPQPFLKSDPQKTQDQKQAGEIQTLWIRKLKYCTDENYLSTRGVSSVVICSKKTSLVEGYGFIEFPTRACAAAESGLQMYHRISKPNSEQNFWQSWASVSTDENFTIFVGDLAVDVKHYLLQKTFRARYPAVKGAKVVIDRLNGRTKGYVFVMFRDESEWLRAITEIKGVFCLTSPMRIGPTTSTKTVTGSKGCQEDPSSRGPELVSAEMDTSNNRLAQGKECNKSSDPIEGPFLPHEIIFEILSRVPADSLLRFKCVCKQWYYLIQDSKFITQHFSRSRILFVYSECKMAGFNVDGTIQEKYITCNTFGGLVVEKGNISGKYRLRNVTTHKIMYLPDPHPLTFDMFHTNNHTTNGEFKLVSIYGTSERPEGFEVLTIDRDASWRPLKSFPVFERAVFAYKTEGLIHLITHIMDGVGSNYHLVVYSLDMGSEVFVRNIMPCTFSLGGSRVTVMNWDGCVSGVSVVEENLKVALLEDFKKHRWNEFVVPLTFLKENSDMKKNIVPNAFLQGILWLSYNGETFMYNPELRKIIDILPLHKGNTHLVRSRATLVTFKGMQQDRPIQLQVKPSYKDILCQAFSSF